MIVLAVAVAVVVLDNSDELLSFGGRIIVNVIGKTR
jgi:hypothetical protein